MKMDLKTEVIKTIKNILNIDGYELKHDTLLLGHIPEFDSQAVVTLLGALEEHFEIIFEDDEITAEVFESVSTLTAFVRTKL